METNKSLLDLDNFKLAGYSIDDLINQQKKFLFDDYLPFIEANVSDKKFGGFKWNTAYSGENLSSNKRTWYDARGVWVYAYIYNNFSQEKKYLDVIKKTVALLEKVKEKDEILWPWSYEANGQILNEEEPDIYGSLFVAEGFAAYSQIKGNDQYYQKAKAILLECMQLYDSQEYVYKLQYTPIHSFSAAERVLGHWMIMLRVATNMLRIKEDKEIELIADRCVDSLIRKHYNPKYGLMPEVLDKKMNLLEGDMSQFVYIGHAIEALWMLMDEALRRKDQQLFDLASERFKRHIGVAWDDVYGGVFHCLDHVGRNQWLLDKVLWAQHEVMNGLLLLISEKRDDWAIAFFDKMYQYILDTFPQHNFEFSPWKIGGNRTLSGSDGGVRIENYHHPRYLMLSIQMLTKLKDQLEK